MLSIGKLRDPDYYLAMVGQAAEWTAWTAEHGHEASRLREVDALIRDHHRQNRPTLGQELGISRDIERDVGIDLGL